LDSFTLGAEAVSGRLSPWGRAARRRCSQQLLNGLRSGPLHGRGAPQGFHEPAGADVGCAPLRIQSWTGP
jgi:hypothetical protein